MKKRLLALILTVSMVLSMINVTYAKETIQNDYVWDGNMFSDVPHGSWFYDTVKTAYELGLMMGKGHGTFMPEEEITLAETITVATRIHSLSSTGKESFIQDIPWYMVYMDYAIDNGIISQVPADCNSAATREQFAEILAKSVKKEKLPEINRIDDGAIPDLKGHEDIYRLYRAGVLTGTDSKGTFAPETHIERCEAAAIISRMLRPNLRKNITLIHESVSHDGSSKHNDEEGQKDIPPVIEEEKDYEENVRYSNEQIVIKMEHGKEITSELRDAGVAELTPILELPDYVWYRATITGDIDSTMASVKKLPEVLSAEYDYVYAAETSISNTDVLPSDIAGNSQSAQQWYLKSYGIPEQWEAGHHGEGTVVAVIDTGVDYTHQDLKDNIWINENEVPDNDIDDDNNGYIDDYYGWNAVADNGNPMDDNGHGTHVAGIIGGVNNNLGIVGIAYKSRIMCIKAGSAGGYFNNSDVVEAVYYAYKNGADVINMSFGGEKITQAMEDVLQLAYTQSVLVASAGNNGDPNEPSDEYIYKDPKIGYPAALDYVIGVMSVGEKGVESRFTNWDAKKYNTREYELYAPGENILSTILDDEYGKLTGTSMAAPVVSAMAAILRSVYPDQNMYSTKFMYGQLIASGDRQAVCFDKEMHRVNRTVHELANIVDIDAAVNKNPEPKLYMNEDKYAIFDTKGIAGNIINNGDGICDAGETVSLGVTIGNLWGKSADSEITFSAGGKDPYVKFSTDGINFSDSATVNFGEIGTYSEKDNGKILDNGELIGWENPFYIHISPDCPNEYSIVLRADFTFKNGLTGKPHTRLPEFLKINVNRGKVIPNIIEKDTTLTSDDFYILPNSCLIPEGVTVNVEAGTNIQFWSDGLKDPYATKPIVYITVEGKLNFNGTADNPINIYPNQSMDKYRVEIKEVNNGKASLINTNVVNPYLYITYAEGCKFTQNYRNELIMYREMGSNGVKEYSGGIKMHISKAKECVFEKLGNAYGCELNGNYDTCLFADCALEFKGTEKNCVFYGNNNYLGEKHGDCSELKLPELFDLEQYGDINIFKNPDTGVTYILETEGAINDAQIHMRFGEQFSKYLGGYMACINSEEERLFLQKNLLGFNAIVIGLHEDEKTGNLFWEDGSAYELNNDIKIKHPGKVFCLGSDGSITYGKYAWGCIIEIPPSVEEIILPDNNIVMGINTEYQIFPQISPSYMAGDKLIFESLDENIAKVSATGNITGVGFGSTKVIVWSSNRSASAVIDVNVQEEIPIERIDLGPDFSMEKGSETHLHPTVYPEYNTEQIVYSSDREDIASVAADGTITAKSGGTAVITARGDNNHQISDSVTVTVEVLPESISAEEKLYMTSPDGSESLDALKVSVLPVDAINKNIIWESSNPEIVKVENGQLIKGKEGYGVLRATVEGTNIYTEIAVILSNRSNNVRVTQMQYDYRGFYAVLEDGTLWYCGQGAPVPLQLKTENVRQISCQFDVQGDHNDVYILTKNDELQQYRHNINTTKATTELILTNTFNQSNPMYNIKSIDSAMGTFAALTADGIVYGWGNSSDGRLGSVGSDYIESAIQLTQIDIADIEVARNYVYLLKENGDVYISDSVSSGWHIIESGVKGISSFDDDYVLFDMGDKFIARTNEEVIDYIKKGDKQFITKYTDAYLENGILYFRGGAGNHYGEWGIGRYGVPTYPNNNKYVPVVKLTDVSNLFYGLYNYYFQTANGGFYSAGNNEYNTLGNLSSESKNCVPSRVYFGINIPLSVPSIESTNITASGLTEPNIILDYNQSLYSGSTYGAVAIMDSQGQPVPFDREIHLDKVIFKPIQPFKPGETYVLSIPEGAFKTIFNMNNHAENFTFQVKTEAHDIKKVYLMANAGQPETVKNDKWTVEYVKQQWNQYTREGISPYFYNNVILNRLNYKDSSNWMKIVASERRGLHHALPGNYWGTTNKRMIENQIIDFDDYQNLMDIHADNYLTEAPENVWPFVVSTEILNQKGEPITSVGNETFTFIAHFNRDMDTSIPLWVYFGSKFPYADYNVRGSFTDARTWKGNFTLTSFIEGGYNYWSIKNGCAADNANLKLFNDWGRFDFEIDSLESLSMNIFAEAQDNGNLITWQQDDFDTLAGYNVYRSEQNGGLETKINTSVIPANTKSFFDSNIESGKVYYYTFTVVKTDFTESRPSGRTRVLSKDTLPPTLVHTPISFGTQGRNLVIDAIAMDELGLSSVTLYYRIQGANEWTAVPMNNFNDKYSAIVPGTSLQTAGLEYYIEASDGVSTVYRGAADSPYKVTVREAEDSSSLGDVNGSGNIDILDAYELLQLANGQLVNNNPDILKRADIDGDGILTSKDALTLLKYVNGEIGSLRPGV